VKGHAGGNAPIFSQIGGIHTFFVALPRITPTISPHFFSFSVAYRFDAETNQNLAFHFDDNPSFKKIVRTLCKNTLLFARENTPFKGFFLIGVPRFLIILVEFSRFFSLFSS